MPGPGEYVPDVTEGITSPADLPKPRLEQRSRTDRSRRCPHRGRRAGRYAVAVRTLHDLGAPHSRRPIDIVLTCSKHHCPTATATSASTCPTGPCPSAHPPVASSRWRFA
jgi:hypothetical protein